MSFSKRVSASAPLAIHGAAQNNLKNISLTIPHDSLVVVTGISGSGKSSLAFETVFAEGQRRYVETFSPYIRQYFDKIKKPLVDQIEHVRPAIAIQQRTKVTNSRSTVGSLTNVNDYLKVLWSHLAVPVCPECHWPLKAWTAKELSLHLVSLQRLRRSKTMLVVAPLDTSGVKKIGQLYDRLIVDGFSRFLDPLKCSIERLEETSRPALLDNRKLLLVLDRVRLGA